MSLVCLYSGSRGQGLQAGTLAPPQMLSLPLSGQPPQQARTSVRESRPVGVASCLPPAVLPSSAQQSSRVQPWHLSPGRLQYSSGLSPRSINIPASTGSPWLYLRVHCDTSAWRCIYMPPPRLLPTILWGSTLPEWFRVQLHS